MPIVEKTIDAPAAIIAALDAFDGDPRLVRDLACHAAERALASAGDALATLSPRERALAWPIVAFLLASSLEATLDHLPGATAPAQQPARSLLARLLRRFR